ncbi:autoinducer binding domain-containing protein [Sphingomonas qilianensis]|uniref:Autoinducer binding domain-containing protein n=1 Tax=Sphingomonas qilianensis TaxID=1736690 RepID=A0ABU9XWP9_9SPHN
MSIVLDNISHSVELCTGAASPAAIPTVLDQFGSSFGFDRYLLRISMRSRGGPSRKLRVTNYAPGWLSHYQEAGYAMVDPAVSHARDQAGAACLQGLLDKPSRSRKLKQFSDDIRTAKLIQGITVPLRTAHLAGFLNLHTADTAPSHQTVRHSAIIFAAGLSDMLTRLLLVEDERLDYDKLTLRERQVLFWASAGKTAWETSVILGITERTIVAHLINCAETLGCSNRSQMLGRVAFLLDSDPALNIYRLEL